jgi:UPF0755 protein
VTDHEHGEWERRDVRRRQARRRARRRLVVAVAAVLAAVVAVGVVVSRRGSDPPPVATAPPTIKLTFPEGLRREDMARLIEEKTNLSGQEYLAATAPGARGTALAGLTRPTSLEGFLFPATYEIGTETTIPYLVDRQVEAYQRHAALVKMGFARSKHLTTFDVLTIASMVEREVAVPSERALVAGVIYNRLKARMRLDIDATVQYAVGEWRDLTAADLAVDSPYNTRKFAGLPPGPISNPGLASLEAAAHPKASDFLYYVARNDGTGRHYFARTPAEFEVAKAKARANAAKSPQPSP